ncbi:MAG TPA: hypothetical protein VGL46_21505 [Pseudonocardiaceae bacterium]|jgi:hypothetical protein
MTEAEQPHPGRVPLAPAEPERMTAAEAHGPRWVVPGGVETEAEERLGDVVDPGTGRPRVLSSKCPTCIRRPGIRLAPGRLAELEGGAVETGSWITCHETLPGDGIPVGVQAICRGFWDLYREASVGCRLVQLCGGPVFADLDELLGAARREEQDAQRP